MENEKNYLLLKYEDELLDLIDNMDEIPRSDLQGCVSAILKKLDIELKKKYEIKEKKT
jgi:hypothetical protein